MSPICVGDLGERRELVDAEVVHQDIDLWNSLRQLLRAFRSRRIGQDRENGRTVTRPSFDGAHGLVELRSGAAGQDDMRPFGGQALRDTTGRLEDGRQVAPVRSLHVGVVSSDMGVGPVANTNNCEHGGGDDGRLIVRNQRSFLTFDAATGNAAAFAHDVAALATLGTDGCNYEQPLESILTALSPRAPTAFTAPGYVAPTFRALDGVPSVGHGDELNADFLRPGAVLAIVLITDEDDCSAEDPSFFAGTGSTGSRCAQHHAEQWATSRYVDGLLALRQSPSQIVFSAIVGVPQSVDGQSAAEILDARVLAEHVTNDEVDRSCTRVGTDGMDLGHAAPPTRIVTVARDLEAAGASTSVHSICSTSYHAAMNDVLARIGGALGTACLPRALNLDASGEAGCDVFELLPAVESGAEFTHCAQLPGAGAFSLERVETSTVLGASVHRELCRVSQVVRGTPSATGWYYDDGRDGVDGPSAMPEGCDQGIAFAQVHPVAGAEVRFECAEHLFPSSGAVVQLGSFCDPSTGADGTGELAESPGFTCGMGTATPGFASAHMACDGFDRTCQLSCDDSSDCTAGGLLGYACDLREAQEIFGTRLPAGISAHDVHGVCVNPTCHQD